jgi:hypothetical protein
VVVVVFQHKNQVVVEHQVLVVEEHLQVLYQVQELHHQLQVKLNQLGLML